MPAPPALLLLALSLSAVLTCLLVEHAAQLPFSKHPSLDRWHTTTTPDSGGLALFAALAVVYLGWFRGRHTVVAAAATALWLLGTLDDRRQFRAHTKFAAQGLVVTLAVAGGVVMHASSWPLLNWVLSWFWLIGITNAFNLIDNMDGLAAGVAVLIAACRGFALYLHGAREEALLSGVIAAAFVGFLLFNGKPARIFMGDGGSMLAGFSLAALTVVAPLPHAGGWMGRLLGPTLLFAYPIFDTALVSVLRRAAGRSIAVGGRDHSSHRLASSGWSERTVVGLLWAFAALGCAGGLLLVRWPAAGPAASLLGVFAVLFGFLVSRLPAARARARQPWLPAVRAVAGGLLDALMTALAVLAAWLSWRHFELPDAAWEMLLVAFPLVMLVHAAAAALARTGPARRLGFATVVPLARIALLVAALASLLRSTGSYPRGAALAYPLCAFLLGLGLRSWRPAWSGDGFRHPPADRRRPVAILGTGAESRALARFLRDAYSLGLRPATFLEEHADVPARVGGLPVTAIGPGPARLSEHGEVSLVLLPGSDAAEHAATGELLRRAGWQVGTIAVQPAPDDAAPPAYEEFLEPPVECAARL